MTATSKVRGGLRVLLWTLLIAAVALEGGARLVLALNTFSKTQQTGPAVAVTHDSLTIPDPRDPRLWRLRPGLSQTFAELLRSFSSRESRDYYRALGARLGVHPGDIAFQINSAGYKGPEIDPAHRQARILTLGDSVTFGSLFDRYAYPRVLERTLRQAGCRVEVVNGGVPGYRPMYVRERIDEYAALRPEVTTIFLGWNDIYNENMAFGAARYLASVRLAEKVARRIEFRFHLNPGAFMYGMYSRATDVAPGDAAVREARTYVPAERRDVEAIIRRLQAARSRVILLTLAGLFVTDEKPSEHALSTGHLPPFTHNPYVLAAMTDRYNDALRGLARRYAAPIIDLDRWSTSALRPRDQAFTDAVHLQVDAQEKVGRYVAEQLLIAGGGCPALTR